MDFIFTNVSLKLTLGARDFPNAVSARGFGLRPKLCRPSADTENSRRTHRPREKPLVPRVFKTAFLNLKQKHACLHSKFTKKCQGQALVVYMSS